MKFRNKTTKIVLDAKSDFAIEQLKKNNDYEEIKEIEKHEVVKPKKTVEKTEN